MYIMYTIRGSWVMYVRVLYYLHNFFSKSKSVLKETIYF